MVVIRTVRALDTCAKMVPAETFFSVPIVTLHIICEMYPGWSKNTRLFSNPFQVEIKIQNKTLSDESIH